MEVIPFGPSSIHEVQQIVVASDDERGLCGDGKVHILGVIRVTRIREQLGKVAEDRCDKLDRIRELRHPLGLQATFGNHPRAALHVVEFIEDGS